jgi:hypothetical protein
MFGHNFQKEYFKEVIKNNRLGPGYIFDGKEGVGKKLFSIYLTKYFFCENKTYFGDCECQSCITALNYKHPFILLLNEDQLKIDTIRGLNEFIYLGGGSIKFIIIDNIHKITKEAAAAFLKTLEESPNNVVFILLTSDYLRVLPTIKSRCFRIPFNRLTHEEVTNLLKGSNQEIFNNNYYFTGSINDAYKSKELFELGEFFKNDTKSICEMIFKIQERGVLKNLLYAIIFHLKINCHNCFDLHLFELFDFLYLLIKRIDENINIEIIKSLTIILISEVIHGAL